MVGCLLYRIGFYLFKQLLLYSSMLKRVIKVLKKIYKLTKYKNTTLKFQTDYCQNYFIIVILTTISTDYNTQWRLIKFDELYIFSKFWNMTNGSL